MGGIPVGAIDELHFIKGYHRKVAVDCWFTSEGRSIPHLIKYEDDDGCRHTLDHVWLVREEKRNHAGLMVQRYDCKVEDHGYIKDMILLFRPGVNTWDMILQ